MSLLASNLKYLRRRQEQKLTQERLAQLLAVSPSTYGSYEEGRAEPRLDTLLQICQIFSVTTEDILTVDLSKVEVIGASGELGQRAGHGRTRILVATVDKEGIDNIEMVPVKAAAGYARGYADPDFIQGLPTFQVPFLDTRRKHRAFAVSGDSMPPVPDGALVFGQFVENWWQIKDGSLAVVVTQNDGVVFKKIFNYLKDRACLVMASTNPIYQPFVVPEEEIQEVWSFAGYFTKEFTD